PKIRVHAVQNGLVTCGGERHRDAVQRHPVDLALPLLPLPVGGGVAEGAEVQVVDLVDLCPSGRWRSIGKLGEVDLPWAVPVQGETADVLEVVAQGDGGRDAVARGDGEFPVPGAIAEATGVWRVVPVGGW